MKPALPDPLNAFCAHSTARLQGAPGRPLSGLAFAAKDLFDIAGHVTGAGNPDWLALHPPASRTAPVVQALVDAGADMVGKTHTDELSRGILGENAHYGTPTNPKAPRRVPGGSSSGSAAAVAGGLVDFAIGTDTGGSVRIPASFCGIFGIRPSHGRLSLAGVVGQAPSFDTVGWFAREADLLARVGEALLGAELRGAPRPRHVIVATDAFAVAEPATASALRPAVERIAALVDSSEERPVSASVPLADWFAHQRAIQGREAWETFGDWIDRNNPRFAFEIADNFLRGMRIEDTALTAARRIPGGASARASRNACARHDRLPADGAVSGAAPSPAALDHVGETHGDQYTDVHCGHPWRAAALAARRVCRRPSGRAFPLGATRGRRDAARLRTRAAAGVMKLLVVLNSEARI